MKVQTPCASSQEVKLKCLMLLTWIMLFFQSWLPLSRNPMIYIRTAIFKQRQVDSYFTGPLEKLEGDHHPLSSSSSPECKWSTLTGIRQMSGCQVHNLHVRQNQTPQEAQGNKNLGESVELPPPFTAQSCIGCPCDVFVLSELCLVFCFLLICFMSIYRQCYGDNLFSKVLFMTMRCGLIFMAFLSTILPGPQTQLLILHLGL